jgi:glycopeptide antibiotics resistance protein
MRPRLDTMSGLAPQRALPKLLSSPPADFATAPVGAALETDADAASGARLSRAVLGYLVAVTLLITWAPFDFALAPQHGVEAIWTWSDLILNVVMFLPLGFVAQATGVWRRDRPWRWWSVGLLGALLSVGIELGQLLLASRVTSVVDVASNALGAALGAWAFTKVRRRLPLGSGTVSALALELPLTGLVILLVPLLWVFGFASDGGPRIWLLLPMAAFGGALLGGVHGAYLAPHAGAPRWSVALVAALWCLLGALPGGIAQWDVLLGASLLAAGLGFLRSHAAARTRRREGTQRVELPTLRLALPAFATYVTLGALWPLTQVDGTWRAAWMLVPARDDLSNALLMQQLEYLAAFTVVGYITAELHGRANATYRAAWPRVLRRAGALALLLEGARGWNAAVGASGALLLLAIGAGVFGGWLYHLQRDHVRTLRAGPVGWTPRLIVVGRRRHAA